MGNLEEGVTPDGPEAGDQGLSMPDVPVDGARKEMSMDDVVMPGTGKPPSEVDVEYGLVKNTPEHGAGSAVRQSELASRTTRDTPSDELTASGQFLVRGGFVDKTASGVYTFLPMGVRILNKIENRVRESMEALGSQELAFPVLQPKGLLESTGRWDVDVLYKLQARAGKELSLAFTHEENCADYMGRLIQSYRDLPVSVFQIQSKFRDEPRAKSGIMRGKEFRMKDMYSFHPSQEDLDRYYDHAHLAYMQLYKDFGLGDRTFLTYASGGDYSPYSHEYQTLCDVGEDTIYVCRESGVAINKEILEELNGRCPVSGSTNLEEHKAVEVGNIFKLGTRFTDAYGYAYSDVDGGKKPIYMASYGVGISRVMGTVAELHNDEHGLNWPEAIAPFQVHLVSIGRDDEAKRGAEEMFDILRRAGVEVLYDDRPGIRPGQKFSESDLLGIPQRIVIGGRLDSEGKVELKARGSSEPEAVSKGDILKALGAI